MFRVPIFLIRVGGFGCWLVIGREKRGGGQREKGEGRREKGEGRREKGEGRRMGRRNRIEEKRRERNRSKTPKNTNIKPTKPTKPVPTPPPQRSKSCRKSTNHKPQTPYPHIPAQKQPHRSNTFPGPHSPNSPSRRARTHERSGFMNRENSSSMYPAGCSRKLFTE